ncbi:hypothetical protein THAOC_12790 [Thalassiosira oceanica]|uniref:Uncharacterized protein n=1 Tax=Thalassiosira oceanica TaxID=159749 RepID=K0T786_THAOC|nr:hypothetical protein THAOC_12790 [Thalassiosira oceanica]|eukprot:EJK66297.1 hypothetical protein THAOC_12790 [Thalassiosira oceanica]
MPGFDAVGLEQTQYPEPRATRAEFRRGWSRGEDCQDADDNGSAEPYCIVTPSPRRRPAAYEPTSSSAAAPPISEPEISVTVEDLGVSLDIDINEDWDLGDIWDVMNLVDPESFEANEKETLKMIRKADRVCMPRELGVTG